MEDPPQSDRNKPGQSSQQDSKPTPADPDSSTQSQQMEALMAEADSFRKIESFNIRAHREAPDRFGHPYDPQRTKPLATEVLSSRTVAFTEDVDRELDKEEAIFRQSMQKQAA